MANELDELRDEVNPEGRDVGVIEKQLPIKVGGGSKAFEIILWCLAIIPGLIFLFVKINAGKYLSQLQQKLQHDASTIDNYLEQRVVVLENLSVLVEKAIDLDKDVMKNIALYRGGGKPENDAMRNQIGQQIEGVSRNINLAFENYPDLKAHKEIADAIQQNAYLQREITAARELYNDTVNLWNTAVYEWPAKQIVAAKRGYTTRIPYSVSAEVKQRAREVFFK